MLTNFYNWLDHKATLSELLQVVCWLFLLFAAGVCVGCWINDSPPPIVEYHENPQRIKINNEVRLYKQTAENQWQWFGPDGESRMTHPGHVIHFDPDPDCAACLSNIKMAHEVREILGRGE